LGCLPYSTLLLQLSIMQVGSISFCGRTSLNIKSDDVKSSIMKKLEELYDVKIIKRHYQLLRQNHISIINNNPYSLCLRTNGNPYFLYMTQLNFNNTCVFIDRKIQQGYYLPRMIIPSFGFDDVWFEQDTIIEGEMVRDNEQNWIFVMNDLLVHQGQKANGTLLERHSNLHNMLTNHFRRDVDDPCLFQVKRLYKPSELFVMVREFMPSLPYTCRGIYFKPLYNKFTDIYYNFDDSNIKPVFREKFADHTFMTKQDMKKIQPSPLSIQNLNAQTEPKMDVSGNGTSNGNGIVNLQDHICTPTKSSTTSSTTSTIDLTVDRDVGVELDENVATCTVDKTTSIFTIEKTGTPDVYRLFDTTKNICVGNACVPTIKVSKYLQQLFENSNVVAKYTLTCQWSSRFQKWIPSVPT